MAERTMIITLVENILFFQRIDSRAIDKRMHLITHGIFLQQAYIQHFVEQYLTVIDIPAKNLGVFFSTERFMLNQGGKSEEFFIGKLFNKVQLQFNAG